MMLIHAAAYGFYCVGNFVYFMLFTVYSINVENERAWMVFQGGIVFFVFTAFISQVLLCAIFIELGKKRPPIIRIKKRLPKMKADGHFVPVYTEDFDLDDCNLQAAIWNTFVKRVNEPGKENYDDDEDDQYWVSGESLALAAEDFNNEPK